MSSSSTPSLTSAPCSARFSFLELGRNIGNADRAVKEHGLVLDAVRSGDVLLAAERAGEHVQRSLQDYRDAIERRFELDKS